MDPPRLLTAMVHWAIANWAPNEKMTKTKRERLQLAAMVILRQFAPEFFIKAKI